LSAAGAAGDGTMNAAAARAMREGYLVPRAGEIAREKPAPARPAPRAGVLDVRAPATVRGFNGIRQPNSAPSDSTGAVGTTRYIELVNTNFAIYNKTSNTPLATGTLNQLAGEPAGNNIFDPQVIWDPTTNRFYYAMDDIASATDNRLAIGFSKTATPNSAADFCHYVFDYGSFFPDYPKLGDSRDFFFMGVNTFNSANAFVGSDVVWISKPPAGSACPPASSFKAGTEIDLEAPAGNAAFTPVGVNQTDTNATGWLVAVNSNPSTRLSLFRVTRNATTGNAVVQNPGTQVAVASYSAPPNIPQQGTANQLDSLDRRLTQAVSGIDPGHANEVGIWTQHTVARTGGLSEVRWYEIDPLTKTLLQNGKVTSASLFYFNGSISPNRAVMGATRSGGNSMVMGFNASSSAVFPRVRMVSKIGAGAQSAPVNVRTSPTFYRGFDCPPNPCRWGDYAASTPDPNPPAGTSRIWSTSQYAINNPTPASASGWGTWNWVANP
jgi:hypothetical protein